MMGDNGVDLASIFGSLKVTLGNVDDRLKAANKIQQQATKANLPVFNQTQDTVIIPANGLGVVRLTGPDQGHFWYVRRVIVGGLTPTTVAAGRADLFVSAADHRSRTALNQFAMTDWRDQTASLPNIATYSRGGLNMRLNEELYVVFSSATVGQQYVAMCQFEDYEEAAIRQDWAV